jgi:hypothetical protein
MLRNAVSEFSLSRAGKVRGPRPSFRPALEALEERVVLHGVPPAITMGSIASQIELLHLQVTGQQIDPQAALVRLNALEAQYRTLKHDTSDPNYKMFPVWVEEVQGEIQQCLTPATPTPTPTPVPPDC